MTSQVHTARPVLDPARAEVLQQVPDSSPQQVDEVVRRARVAFAGGRWSRCPRRERAEVLTEVGRRIRQHAVELAETESRNVGKPIVQARGDVLGAAETFEVCAQVIGSLTDEVIDGGTDQTTLVVREPVGVVAGIVPWNYPLAIAAGTLAPALAAGNSVVLKPSPETPLSALRLEQLAGDLFPPGVLGLVTGGVETGRHLVAQPQVDRVQFTGSTRAGHEIMAAAAVRYARLGLELGGKSATLVFADAPLRAAAASAVWRFTANQGENCGAGSRLLVEAAVYDEFLEAVLDEVRTLVVGDPMDEATAIGPMISQAHRQRVQRHLDAAAATSTLLHQGAVPDRPPLDRGFFVPPSVWETEPGTALWHEEVFGPVLAVRRFEHEDEAVELANHSTYGLMAHVWCGDRGRAVRIARRIDAGVIRINKAVEGPTGPWGGMKSSGIGRNLGRYGIDAASELKQICLDLR